MTNWDKKFVSLLLFNILMFRSRWDTLYNGHNCILTIQQTVQYGANTDMFQHVNNMFIDEPNG